MRKGDILVYNCQRGWVAALVRSVNGYYNSARIDVYMDGEKQTTTDITVHPDVPVIGNVEDLGIDSEALPD